MQAYLDKAQQAADTQADGASYYGGDNRGAAGQGYAGYGEQSEYDAAYYEQERKNREYSEFLATFMQDFEPSDELVVEIEAQATQTYMLRVTQIPTVIKLVVAVVSEDAYPVITKVFKQGNPRPIKEYKGQTEVLGVIEVYEEMDAGTYVVEFTNPVYKLQDLTFIFK